VTLFYPENMKTASNLDKPICFKKNLHFRKILGDSNQTDAMKNDVYDLGMTLLSAFYLHEPISRQKCAPYNRSLLGEYPILKIIKMMVMSI